VVLAVVAGLVVAPSVYGAVTGPDGTVAVVEIDGSIDSATAQHVEDNLREARNNDSIEAVVLEVDSGADSRTERTNVRSRRPDRVSDAGDRNG